MDPSTQQNEVNTAKKWQYVFFYFFFKTQCSSTLEIPKNKFYSVNINPCFRYFLTCFYMKMKQGQSQICLFLKINLSTTRKASSIALHWYRSHRLTFKNNQIMLFNSPLSSYLNQGLDFTALIRSFSVCTPNTSLTSPWRSLIDCLSRIFSSIKEIEADIIPNGLCCYGSEYFEFECMLRISPAAVAYSRLIDC